MNLIQVAVLAWIIWRLWESNQKLTVELLHRTTTTEQILVERVAAPPARRLDMPVMDDEWEAFIEEKRRKQARDYIDAELELENA